MGYLFTKVLTHLAMPLGSGGAVILLGVMASALRRRRLGVGLALIGLLWIWLWATPVFSDWVRRSLEGRYPPVAIEALPNADAILVLGGAVEGVVTVRAHDRAGRSRHARRAQGQDTGRSQQQACRCRRAAAPPSHLSSSTHRAPPSGPLTMRG